MKNYNKTEIMNRFSRKTKTLELPEQDVTVTLKSLSAQSVVEAQGFQAKGDQINFAYSLIAHSIVDEKGKNPFTVEDCADWDYSVVNTLLLAILELNNLNPDVVEKAQEQLKNQHSSSTTD